MDRIPTSRFYALSLIKCRGGSHKSKAIVGIVPLPSLVMQLLTRDAEFDLKDLPLSFLNLGQHVRSTSCKG